MSFWKNQRVWVTGGNGFLGHHVLEQLRERGVSEILAPRRRDCDLAESGSAESFIRENQPTLILHLAAVCGGIGANAAEPGRYFYENAMMGLQLLEAARRCDVQKVVTVGTICAYPKFTPVPFKEDDLWNGYPEETNAPYGLAKKMLLVQSQAYRDQWGSNFVYLLPVNLYGPRDNFDLNTSHVIPAMLRKMEEARRADAPEVILWGTGAASREFLYVEDCARGILMAAEKYDGRDPVNLGAGFEITIRDLAEKIQRLVGYSGRIVWDSTKPDGQPRRQLDVRRANEGFGFSAQVNFDDGLARTLAWFRESQP
jgi:GDP-L-fucose synthase